MSSLKAIPSPQFRSLGLQNTKVFRTIDEPPCAVRFTSKYHNGSAAFINKTPRKSLHVLSKAVHASIPDSRGLPLPSNLKLVGMGGVGVDYLAVVPYFPKPDEKMRSEALEVQGGGNCGNALSAAARLGLKPEIVTKVGLDGTGEEIISGLAEFGIGTSGVVRSKGSSPMTYIIVDKEGESRTCIHTPGPEMELSEMTADLIASTLEGARLVYFDGRLTEAAVLLARAAREAGVQVLVEAERIRPGLDDLLPLADFIVTSKHFPMDFTGEPNVADAALVMMDMLPNAKTMITTLGSKGSFLIERAEGEGLESVVFSEALETFMANAAPLEVQESAHVSLGLSSSALVCTLGSDQEKALAARQAAQQNADQENSAKYASTLTATACPVTVSARVAYSPAWPLDSNLVVDTTGAGDSFIGSTCYAICAEFSRARTLQLASFVAATNCRSLGPRPGLPTRDEVPEWLLASE